MMNIKIAWTWFWVALLSAAPGFTLLGVAAGGSETEAPHVVIILADDLGYGDVRVNNPASRIPTPNIDRLASQGMRFTDAHTPSAVCTPTRYGLLTGRYAWRTRLKSGVLFPPRDAPLIGPDRKTLGSLLQKAGYATACVGKWHLGIEWARDDKGEVDFNQPFLNGPPDLGFDEFFGVAASLDMVPYGFYENRSPVAPFTTTQPALPFPRFVREGPKTEAFDPGEVLPQLAAWAEDFITRRATADKPFFLYLALTAPHKPVWPAERFEGSTDLGPYGDFVHETDWAVGQVMNALENAQVAENTMVFLTSDNGSYMYRLAPDVPDHVADPGVQGFHPEHHTANAGWRGTKADIWEAGHRVPFVVRWPGRVKPATVSAHTLCLTDIFATLADALGLPRDPNTGEDSFSFLPVLKGSAESLARPPVIHHSGNGMFAVREGPWKLVLGNGSGGREKPRGKPFTEPYALFNLEADPGESQDLAEGHPDRVARMAAYVDRIREDTRSVPLPR